MQQALAEHFVEPNGTPSNGRAAVRLNLGAGDTHLAGFQPVDRKLGTEVYPLACPDNSVEEILASHVLEHFSHRQAGDVLQHWVDKLKPGGRIRIAVPDFQKICMEYMAGRPINVQGYVMGGHVDANDHHGTLFDVEALTELMINCGLERIGPWKSDLPACSSLPISLNLQGYKPSSPVNKVQGVVGVISTPRFGPLMHPQCIQRSLPPLGIVARSTYSCFWHQAISNLMEEEIANPELRYVLTLDFDTVFDRGDVLELYRLMEACPDVDAVFPLQSKRITEQVLCGVPREVHEGDFQRNLLPATTGHFGLTLLRADTLRKFPRPWMIPTPNAEGIWKDGQIDADISFWKKFGEHGYKACLAPKVVVGHLEEVIKWPGPELTPIYQQPGDYDENGIPAEVRR